MLRLALISSALLACTSQIGGNYEEDDIQTADVADVDAGPAPEEPDFPDAMPPMPSFSAPCGDSADAKVEIAGNCIEYFFAPLNWSQAQEVCKGRDGDLISIDSTQTNSIVTALVPTSYPEAWIRGTDAAQEGSWTWDGESMTFTNWRSGEPNNANGNEHCMLIEAHRGGSWDDRNCGEQLSYVCQRPAP